jgi:hypothetical protein
VTDILLATDRAEANGDLVLGDLTALLGELTDIQRERFLYLSFVEMAMCLTSMHTSLSLIDARMTGNWRPN